MTIDDMITIEEGEDHEEIEFCLQRAINSGTGWHMPGSYGRAMMAAIKNGRCMLGREPMRDAYGNRIPSRTEVLAGTPGSREYVEEQSGVDWADQIGEL